MTKTATRRIGALAGLTSLALVAGATAARATTPPATAGTAAAAGVSLQGTCPDTVTIQTDWWPEAEHGGLYELVGPGYTIDKDAKNVTGPLVSKGQDTGVKVQIRAGGSAIPGSVADEMVAHDDIMLGYFNIEGSATNKAVKLLSVVAPLEKNPQMIMWDPATYPDVTAIKDLQQHDVPVLVFGKGIVAKWMIAKGILKDGQFDTSFDGSPDRFVADGKVAMQGFATAEPYKFEHDLPSWNKPIAFQTYYDAGWKTYSQTLAILADDKAKLAPCLKLLVPIIQQAQVDYIQSPDTANAIIGEAVKAYDNFWTQSPELMRFSDEQQLKLGIVGNGDDATLGNMDEARIQTVIDELKATPGVDLRPDVTAGDLYTNEFIDPSIGLPAGSPATGGTTAATTPAPTTPGTMTAGTTAHS